VTGDLASFHGCSAARFLNLYGIRGFNERGVDEATGKKLPVPQALLKKTLKKCKIKN